MAQQLFGELALQLGYLTQDQLTRTLSLQSAEDAADGPHRPLGLICMQEGYLTFDQVMQVLERQNRVADPGS